MAYYNDLKKYGTKTAIIDKNENEITYEELDEFCIKIGQVLEQRKLVFSFCENSIGSICGYVAFLYNSVVPVLLDKHIEKDLRKNLISIYQPDYLYIPEELVGDMETENPDIVCIYSDRNYSLYKTTLDQKHELYEELALLLTTSGSTGSPKLVRQSYKNIQSNAESIAEYLNIDETERPITTLPMNYTYGLSIINSHLLCGATMLVTDNTLMERQFWDFFKKEKATSFGGVPYTYEMLKKLRFFNMDLPSLRYMTQAGGKLAPVLHKEFAEYAEHNNKKFIVMYGQCEATARMAYLPAEYAVQKYGSMGIAIPGGKLELIDVNGKKIETSDTVGELVYYGENVTLGYGECAEDLKLGDERAGRLETGDMAKRDEDGFYYIVGRKKRFLKIFGNRVNLDELERMVKTFFVDNQYEAECACSGIDDNLYVFITRDDKEMGEKVKHFLAAKTGLNPTAFSVKYINSIPKNEAGKTLYKKLEEFYDGI